MLTPNFRLEQDDEYLYFKIRAPYTNVRDTEVDVDDCNFIFSSEPYFLRLKLPGAIVEDDTSTGKYEYDSGEFLFRFRKLNRGEVFPGLEMVTSLLAPRDIPDLCKDLVEVLGGDEDVHALDSPDSPDLPSALPSLTNRFPYGFANKTCCDFELGYEFPNIFELPTPNEVSVDERKELRRIHENGKFSEDHYLADLFDNELLEPLLEFRVRRYDRYAGEAKFSDEEIFILKDLPNKEYLLTQQERNSVLYGLADVLFAYCYDIRTTLDDDSVESSWTINKLSATLSWFETFVDVKEMLVSCFRRALIYPMYRHFALCNKVRSDLVYLLGKDRTVVVKCLLDIYKAMNTSHDARYILNQLYIKDFIIFAQKCDVRALQYLSDAIAVHEIKKSDLDFELEELEAAAIMVYNEQDGVVGNNLAARVANLRLIPTARELAVVNDNDSSNTESSSSSSDSSDSSSSSSDEPSSELDSDDDDDDNDNGRPS